MKIYRVITTQSSKIYVGQTSGTLVGRLVAHKKHARNRVNRCLYDAMNKHGAQTFSIELIEECADVDADVREKHWIKELGSLHPHGYNMTPGGGGGNTLKAWSPKKKAALYKKQGDARRGPRHPEWKASIKAAAIKREQERSEAEKREIGQKISKTMKERGVGGTFKVLYGRDNPNHVEVDVDLCVSLIAQGWTLKRLGEKFKTKGATVGAKIKAATGRTFTQWRREHGITGTFSNPKTDRT